MDKLTAFHEELHNYVAVNILLELFASIGVVATLVALKNHGIKGLIGKIVTGSIKIVPGAKAVVDKQLNAEIDTAVAQLFSGASNVKLDEIPDKGLSSEEVMTQLKKLKEIDIDPEKGNVFAYVYSTDQDKHHQLITEASNLFSNTNALNAMVFPSLKKMEVDVVRMSASMLRGDPDEISGTMTSGGTESILMALKTYRDMAKYERGIVNPQIVLPQTVHPAFPKGCHYFEIEPIFVPITKDLVVDLKAMEKAITKNTIALVGSAPQYPHGIVEPISDIGKLAKKYSLPLHVDSCIGGFILPWLREAGYEIPDFDFAVPEVTSISADLHKYGFSGKGASVILYKNEKIRKYQFFAYVSWPGGLFGSPSMLGSRAGGPIAGAWAALNTLGKEGFIQLAKDTMETSIYLQSEINQMDDVYILGKPHGTLISFTSDSLNIQGVGNVLEKKGWKVERQQLPDSIHLTLMPQHTKAREKFIEDLKESVKFTKENPDVSKEGNAAMYGMVANFQPAPQLLGDFVIGFLGKIYS